MDGASWAGREWTSEEWKEWRASRRPASSKGRSPPSTEGRAKPKGSWADWTEEEAREGRAGDGGGGGQPSARRSASRGASKKRRWGKPKWTTGWTRPPVPVEFQHCNRHPEWACGACGTTNWRNRLCCYSCQAPHPGGEAHAAALREEGAEQARLRELGRTAQPGVGDEPKATGGDGSGDASPTDL